MPLRVVFWFGREFKLSSEPTIAVYVPTLSALGYFIPPKLNRLGAAFVGGRGNDGLNLFLNENGTLHTGCYMCGSKREPENTHGAHPRNSNTHCICNPTAENGIRKPLAVR